MRHPEGLEWRFLFSGDRGPMYRRTHDGFPEEPSCVECRWEESNLRPRVYESLALTT